MLAGMQAYLVCHCMCLYLENCILVCLYIGSYAVCKPVLQVFIWKQQLYISQTSKNYNQCNNEN